MKLPRTYAEAEQLIAHHTLADFPPKVARRVDQILSIALALDGIIWGCDADIDVVLERIRMAMASKGQSFRRQARAMDFVAQAELSQLVDALANVDELRRFVNVGAPFRCPGVRPIADWEVEAAHVLVSEAAGVRRKAAS